MIRTVLVARGPAPRRVVDALRTPTAPSPGQLRAWLYGDARDARDPLADARGDIIEAPDDRPIGDGWTWDGTAFLPPATAAEPRIITGADFLSLFSPAEVAALWASGPEFMTAALRVAAQNQANLDSPEFTGLLRLAVARGALSSARLAQITAGRPAA